MKLVDMRGLKPRPKGSWFKSRHRYFFVLSFRAACAISDPEDNTIIITGERKVNRYDASGNKTPMPELNGLRGFHGCGSYRRSSDNKLVAVALK